MQLPSVPPIPPRRWLAVRPSATLCSFAGVINRRLIVGPAVKNGGPTGGFCASKCTAQTVSFKRAMPRLKAQTVSFCSSILLILAADLICSCAQASADHANVSSLQQPAPCPPRWDHPFDTCVRTCEQCTPRCAAEQMGMLAYIATNGWVLWTSRSRASTTRHPAPQPGSCSKQCKSPCLLLQQPTPPAASSSRPSISPATCRF